MTVTVQVPGSKSVTHRALLMAARSSRPCRIDDPLRGADTDATMAALRAFGHDLRTGDDCVLTEPTTGHAAGEVDLRNAGTGLRLLTAYGATFSASTSFKGDASLSGRPNGPLLDALVDGGARIRGGPTLPYAVAGPLRAGAFRLPANVSSQYASALLLTLPMLDAPSTLTLEAPVASRPYIDITLEVAKAFGLRLDGSVNDGFDIPGQQVPSAASFTVEGDWSSAAFPAVAAAITGVPVRLAGLRDDSPQGDRAILGLLRAFGAAVQGHRVGGGDLASPGRVRVADTPDLFPALCILAACASGTTTFEGGAALRDKECDRIQAMHEGLVRLGIDAKPTPDGLIVTGGAMRGADVHSFHDHRIHMAFAIADLAATGTVKPDGADSVAVSYPTFHHDLARLREAR